MKMSRRLDVFFPCSPLYVLSGVEIVPVAHESGRLGAWRRFRQLIFITAPFVYFPFSIASHEFQGASFSLEAFIVKVFLLLTFIFRLIIITKGQQIRILIGKMSKTISIRLSRLLLFTCCVFFALHLVITLEYTLAVMSGALNVAFNNGSQLDFALTVSRSFLDSCFYDTIAICMSIYCVSLMLYFNFVREKTSNLLLIARCGNINSLMNGLDEIYSTHHQFESLFNVIPFTWIVHGMCNAVFSLFTGGEGGLDCFFYTRQLTLMCVLLFVCIVTMRIADLGDRVFDVLSRSTFPRRLIPCHICKLLDRAYKSTFTVFHMFDIHVSLIASYIGTVVTFTVLLVQVRNGMLHRRDPRNSTE